MKSRTPLQYAMLSLKGMAMGAADIVPGVSGGTIAFITGIYEELITSLNNFNTAALRKLKTEGLKGFWQHINGTFFVFLGGGILISLFSLVKLVTFLLEEHPVVIWSFFFGLILASVYMVGKKVKEWKISTVISLLLAVALAFWISSIQSVASVDANWFIFLSGAIAICAMILPGISGSFILILLGSYHIVLEGLKEVDLMIIALFGAGCLVGLLSFSKLLKFLFTKFHDQTVAILTGFMLGSLYKVWPWKVKMGTEPLVVHSDGKEDWMMKNVLPHNFDQDALLPYAIGACICGAALILLLDRFAPKEE